LALGFGLAVAAQALMLSGLPLAGKVIAPSPILAGLPYALTLLGAAAASIPASLLLDQFGRRAAFALGASLGTAGGLLAGWAILARHFPGLCIGALWLGMAQGVALFYRHAAAIADGSRSRAALTVLAGGCVASLVVPAIIAVARQAFAPIADSVLMLAAGIASFASLPFMLTLPQRLAEVRPAAPTGLSRVSFWAATAFAACAWFAMARVMTQSPSALFDCGVGAVVIGGFVSWHLVAMYGPMALAAVLRTPLPTSLALGIGVAAITFSLTLPRSGAVSIELLLILCGVGWAFVQIGATRLLHDNEPSPRLALALHDGLILSAALLGAISAGSW
jgi:MFS family permease